MTLTLSVFDIVRLPSWVVEPVIAVSIIFVAVENIVRPRSAHSRLRLAVAFGFGLIHGLGFAGGLLDAMEGLPRIGTWIALAAFSLGVEVGHQVVVLPLFGALAVGRQQWHERFTRPALRYGSVLISVCGVYYLCVALREQFFAR
ncbi:MAG: HupE/UreJ family protein [Chthoniobacter sp.]